MNKLTISALLLVVIFSAVTGCGQSKLAPAAGSFETGNVQVSINWPRLEKARASSIPTTAASIIIVASADDMTPVSAEVTYPQTTGTIEVKVGVNRLISATAKTSSGVIVATGEVAGVTVSLGTNSPVSIALTPVAGRNYFPNTDGNSWRYANSDGTKFIMTFEGTTALND